MRAFTTASAVLLYFSQISNCVDIDFTDYGGCIFDLADSNGITSTYNLSYFHLTRESFQVDDDDIEDWKYRFNICGAIAGFTWENDVPSYCKSGDDKHADPCVQIAPNGTCLEKYNVTKAGKTASAIQINDAHEVCHWMGVEMDGLYGLADYNVSLYDNDDSASGIRYTILNGEWCDIANKNREVVIELICPDSNRYFFDPTEELNIEEVVVEYPPCTYSITYESPLACPNDCIATTSNGNEEYSVCSGNGICVSDPNAGYVRCLCDDGWSGDLCSVEQNYDVEFITTDHSALITSVIICIILLVIGIGLVLYLCHRIRLKEEQMVGYQGQFAQSMLDNDDPIITTDPGTSMGIVGTSAQAQQQAQSFDPRVNVDPTIENEIAAQHAKETQSAGNDDNNNDDNDLLAHGDDDDDTPNDDNNNDDNNATNNDDDANRVEADLLGTDETNQ